MALNSGGRNKSSQFWRADWFVGVLVVLLVLLLSRTTSFLEVLENRFYDYGITQANKKPSDQIALIAIDDVSIANIGRFPWSRDIQAKLFEQISAGKPKAIVNSILYAEPQVEKGLPYLRKISESIAPEAAAANPSLDAIQKIAQEGEAALDVDTKLGQVFESAGNVIGFVTFLPGEVRGKPDKPLKPGTIKSLVNSEPGFAIPVASILEPIDAIGGKFSVVGHGNKSSDADGTIRVESLLMDYYGQVLPSLAMQAAIRGLNLSSSDVRVSAQESNVQVGKLRIATNDGAQMRPFYYADRDGKLPFSSDSAFDVMSGKVPTSKYAGKIVLVGPTAATLGVEFPTPLGRNMTPLEQTAHVTSSILSEHFITTPWWAQLLSVLSLVLVLVYVGALLPRLAAGHAAILTGSLFVLFLAMSFVLLSRYSYWAQLVLPAVALLIGHLALTTKRFLMTEAGKLRSDEESAETNRMMGLAMQGQGQLDAAFDRFRRVSYSDALMDNLSNLALDFERKRQFNKAEAVYEYMATQNKDYKGLTAKLSRAKNLSETVILGGSSSHPGGTMLLDGGGVEKPMLGRYQVEKELGKGAMGVVYLGKDPKIGRVVAIKTMALSQEFEGEELDDARERFFREAETAGRLQHQYIVTIFDAGEEHDLAFIAMEFLKGKDLADVSKTGQLLPIPKVLSIVARVAEALAYAHKLNVVHRDIKPANIMYDPETDSVKVTDFGIARITDSSKTKTGLVLGTPSFMSPEQIAGKRVDGRSDLYSLGVMLFQMLAGVLPFRGDSMAELMYKIANEQAPDIRIIRPELSEKLANVVALSISKNSDTRYQDGDQFAADLRLMIAELGGAPQAAQPVVTPSVTPSVSQPAAAGSSTFESTVVQTATPAVAHQKTQVMTADAAEFEKTSVTNVQDTALKVGHLDTDVKL